MKFIGYGLIPLFTLLYASQGSFLYENFTGIANQEGQKGLLLLWSLLYGGYHYILDRSLFQKYGWHHQVLITVAFLLCLVGPIIPYDPARPHLASFHVLIAFMACALYIGMHFYFLAYLATINWPLYIRNRQRLMGIIITVCLFLFGFGSINSLVECMIAILMNIYVLCFEKEK